jgi:hypothetical protein
MKNFRWILFYVLILLNFSSLKCFSQAPVWSWAKSATVAPGNEAGKSVAIDKPGNVYITGYFTDSIITLGDVTLYSAGNSDVFVAKYSPNGNVLWAKSGGGKGDDFGTKIISDNEGNIYVAGTFSDSSMKFESTTLPNSGKIDMFLVKYNTVGDLIWAKSIPGTKKDQIVNIGLDKQGYIYLTATFSEPHLILGNFTLDNKGNSDMVSVKFTPGGNVVWAKSAGGKGIEGPFDMVTDYIGNSFVLGSFRSDSLILDSISIKSENEYGNLFLAKFNPQGQALWAKLLGESFHNITTDAYGNFYIASSFYDPTLTIGNITLYNSNKDGGYEIVVAKYNKDGNVIWAKSAGSERSDFNEAIAVDNEENIYLIGIFHGDSFHLGNDTIVKEKSSTDNLYVIKYDINGNALWSKPIGYTGNSEIILRNIIAGDNGKLYATGSFYFDSLSLDTITLVNKSSYFLNFDMFVAKIGPSDDAVNKDQTTLTYPNPSQGSLIITGLPYGNWDFTIYTAIGQLIYNTTFLGSESMIDLSGKAKGAYVYRLLKDGEVFKSGKLMLE